MSFDETCQLGSTGVGKKAVVLIFSVLDNWA